MSRYKPASSGGVGALKTFTTTLATPRETLLGTPVALPTTEPATSQISFTIQSSDLPTISPTPLSVKYAALLYSGGKNTDVAAQNVSWRVLKNGASIATGTQTSITAANFWTHGYYQFYDVAVGDILEIRLWSPSANINYDYYAISISPTRMNLGNSYINKDVNYSNFIVSSLTLGNPALQLSQNYNFYPSDSTTLNFSTGATINFGALRWNQSYFSGRTQLSDANITTSTLSHATARPYYSRNTIPATISFHEVT